MAHTSANVRVLSGIGSLYRGPVGTAAPTNATTALAVGYIDMGGIGEDGLEEERDRKTEQIRYDNGELAREVVTESAYTVKVPLIETSQVALEAFYGATGVVATTELGIVIDPSQTGGRFAWVWQAVDGTAIRRTHIPSGEVTEVETHKVTVDEPWTYELTITGYYDATATYTAKSFWAGIDLT